MTVNPNAARAHSLTAVQILSELVRRYVDALPLPPFLIDSDGKEVRLHAWLEALRHDQTPVSTDVASRLDYPAERATIGEIALTLRARIARKSTYTPLGSPAARHGGLLWTST